MTGVMFSKGGAGRDIYNYGYPGMYVMGARKLSYYMAIALTSGRDTRCRDAGGFRIQQGQTARLTLSLLQCRLDIRRPATYSSERLTLCI